MSRRIWIPLVVATALVVGFVAFRPRSESATARERTAVIETGPLLVWVTGTGKVEPAAQSALSFKVPGTLGELNAGVGQRVQAGQVLAVLDPNSLDPALVAAEGDLITAQQALDNLLEEPSAQQIALAEQTLALATDALEDAQYIWSVRQEGNRASSSTIRKAEAELVLAEDALDRAKNNYDNFSGRSSSDPARALALTELVNAERARDSALRNLNWFTGHPSDNEQAILDADVAVAQANLAQAQGDLADLQAGPDPDAVESAEAGLRAAQALVDQVRLVSPINGTVMAVAHAVGDSISPGQIEIVVADLSSLHIDTTVDELDVGIVEIGQSVEITLDALPDLILNGTVAGIDLSPAAGAGSTQYPVRVEVESIDEQVRVGMTAALSILVADEDQAVLVPNWALDFDSDSGEIFVLVYDGEVPERRGLVLGLRSDTFSQVVSGLAAGETVGAVIEERPSNGGLFFGG